MPRVDEDIKLITAAAEELHDYLNSAQLNWPLANSAGILTPGNLLLSLKRTGADKQNNSNAGHQIILNTIGKTIDQHRSAWEKKIAEEIPYRIHLWQNCLLEYLDEEMIDASIRTQVRSRVILDLLIAETRIVDPRATVQIEKLDEDFKHIMHSGPFLWEESTIEFFPMEKYWYLYVQTGEIKP